ncbi:hypothetical protein FOZ62_015201, partial [Perkinsus olseni]
TFVGIYGLQCVFPHEFYYCLHRVVQSASYYCYKIGPMKVGAAVVVVVGAAAYAFGRGWRRRRYDDDWAAAFLRINRSQRWMASSAASDQEASGPLSSQDPLAILSSGGDFVEATRKAVTMYGVFGCGSEEKGSEGYQAGSLRRLDRYKGDGTTRANSGCDLMSQCLIAKTDAP